MVQSPPQNKRSDVARMKSLQQSLGLSLSLAAKVIATHSTQGRQGDGRWELTGRVQCECAGHLRRRRGCFECVRCLRCERAGRLRRRRGGFECVTWGWFVPCGGPLLLWRAGGRDRALEGGVAPR